MTPSQAQMQTEDFVKTAVGSDEYEVQAAHLMLAQSEDAEVRSFAQNMVDDHTRLRDSMIKAAGAIGLAPPAKIVSGDLSKMLMALQSLKGPDLDKAYIEQQVNTHVSALVTQEAYAGSGPDPRIRAAAQSAVPTIAHHLKMAREMLATKAGG